MRLSIVGNPGLVDRSFEKSTRDLFGYAGNNTGNLVFWYAFQIHVRAERKSWLPFFFSLDAVDEINDSDALIFIFANHVNPGMDLGHLTEKLDKIRVPIVALGLGAQSRLGEDIHTLPKGSIEFFRLLSAKTEKIGVRGGFTKSVLAHFGVENTEILGCISNFLSDTLPPALGDGRFQMLSGAHRIGLNNDFIDDVEPLNRMVARIYPHAVLDFIVQAPIDLLHLARNEQHEMDPAYRRRLNKFVKTFAERGLSEHEVLDRVYAFFDTRAWMEHSRRYDLALGSRMHGNMVCFQAGTPAVFIPHDSRTEELASTMALPIFHLADCDAIKSEAEFLAGVQFDRIKYLDTRAELKGRYINLLKNAGLDVTNFLERL